MSYRIDYQTPPKPRKHWGGRLLALGALCVALWPGGRAAVGKILLPPAVSVAALEELAGDLRAGESIRGALEGFCVRVMELG